MHVHPISTFRVFQEGHLLRNSIAIFALTTLFYFIGAELRLVHELSLFWPLNGVMAGVFARYVWLNRLHYYAISYVAMLVYDAITTEWGLVSLAINFSNMMFIVTVALLVVRDKRLGKNKYEPVSALRLFNYCLIAALLCAIVGAIGSVSIDSLDFWPLLADWFSEQFSTGVLIVPCMLTLAIPGVLPRFKAEQMMRKSGHCQKHLFNGWIRLTASVLRWWTVSLPVIRVMKWLNWKKNWVITMVSSTPLNTFTCL